MATAEDAGAAAAAPAKGKGKIVKLLAMVGIVAALVGGGVFAGMKLSSKSKAAAPAGQTVAGEVAADAGASESEGAKPAEGGEGGEGAAAPVKAAQPADLYLQFEPFTTNLADPKGRDYVVATINLEATNAKMLELLNQNLIPLRAATLQMLSSKTREEVSTPAGQERLIKDLSARYKQIVSADAVANIYITDFRQHRQ